MLAGCLALAGCGSTSLEPTLDCDFLVGVNYIEISPPPTLLETYYVNVGDSIQLAGSVRRIDAAQPTFNPQQGWYCVETAGSPVSGVVEFSTNDTQLIRLHANGWIRGLQFGSATVTATSTLPPATKDIPILVYSP
jgi:hypothetical protein